MKKFLIYYQFGSRGDFLANILYDTLNSVNRDYYKIGSPKLDFIKVHTLDGVHGVGAYASIDKFDSYEQMFEFCKQNDLTTIRILIPTDEELLDVAYFCTIKNSLSDSDITKDQAPTYNDVPVINTLYGLTYNRRVEQADIDYRDRYDYSLTFNDLFDIEYLKRFYQQIHGRELSAEVIEHIQHNINLQNRFSGRK